MQFQEKASSSIRRAFIDSGRLKDDSNYQVQTRSVTVRQSQFVSALGRVWLVLMKFFSTFDH